MNALLRTLIFFDWHVSNLETCFSSVGWAVQYFEHKNTWMQDYYTEFCYKNLARLLLGEFGYSAFGVKTKRVSFHLFFQVTTKNPLWVALPAFYIFSWSFSSSPIELRTHKLPFFDILTRKFKQSSRMKNGKSRMNNIYEKIWNAKFKVFYLKFCIRNCYCEFFHWMNFFVVYCKKKAFLWLMCEWDRKRSPLLA